MELESRDRVRNTPLEVTKSRDFNRANIVSGLDFGGSDQVPPGGLYDATPRWFVVIWTFKMATFGTPRRSETTCKLGSMILHELSMKTAAVDENQHRLAHLICITYGLQTASNGIWMLRSLSLCFRPGTEISAQKFTNCVTCTSTSTLTTWGFNWINFYDLVDYNLLVFWSPRWIWRRHLLLPAAISGLNFFVPVKITVLEQSVVRMLEKKTH